jgi:hypothetical protein
MTLKTPTMAAAQMATCVENSLVTESRRGCVELEVEHTVALVLAASDSVAPIKFATRVDAAMEIGNGIWNVSPVMVARMLCAARCVVEK